MDIFSDNYSEKSKHKMKLEYKNKIKKEIDKYIKNGNIIQAKSLIEKYDKMVKDDIEIYSMKAVVAIVEDKLDEAEKHLLDGLKIDNDNFDIFYNLGYVYKQKGDNEKAYESYRHAKKLAINQELREEIKQKIKKLNISGDKIQSSSSESLDSQNDSLIFIGGAGRSGTTLMRVMLNAHRNLCAGPEFKLLPIISDLFHQVNRLESIRQAYFLSVEDIINNFNNFIMDFFGNFLMRSEAKRLVEKTPHNIIHMKELGTIFPNAKFIHVVRDGRDVASSLIRQNWVDEQGKQFEYVKNIRNAAKYWVKIVNKAINDSKSTLLSGRVKIVHYEDLVTNPEKTMKDVLSFLDEPWDEKVLHHEKVNRGYEPEESSTSQVEQQIHTKSLQRWKDTFNESDKKTFKKIGGGLLVELGYEDNLDW